MMVSQDIMAGFAFLKQQAQERRKDCRQKAPEKLKKAGVSVIIKSNGSHLIVSHNQKIAGEYLKKGLHIYLEGQLQTRKWQDQSGQDRYTTEIVANELQMLGGKTGSGYAGGSGQNEQTQTTRSE